MSQDDRRKAYAALIAGVACLAWSAIFVKIANVPGAASAFYRLAIASSILLPLRLIRGGPLPAGRTVGLACIGGVLFGIDLALYNSAVLIGSATTATLVTNTAPVFVGLGSWLFFHHRPSRRFWIGLCLAILGTAIVARASAKQSTSAGWGDLLALGSAVFYAGYLLVTRLVRTSVDTLTLATISFLASAASLLVFSVAMELPLTGYSLRSWIALLCLGLITQLGGYLAVSYALGHLPVTIGSVWLLAQIPVTAVLAAGLLGERVGPAQIAGGVLVLAGIFVVTRESS